MRVLVIPQYHVAGGARTFLQTLLSIHMRHNIETAVLVEERQDAHPEVIEMLKEYKTLVFRGRNRAQLFFKASFSPLHDIVFCMRAFLAFKPDLIVVSNTTPGLMSGVLFYPVPVIVVLHTYPSKRLHWPGRLVWALGSRMGNWIVSVSEFCAEQIRAYMSVSSDRIRVIYNSFQPVQRDGVPRADSPVILTVARIDGTKNPNCWLDVARQVATHMPEVRFVWVGDGPSRPIIEEQIEKSGLDGTISLPGNSHDPASYYSNAAIYFQPSSMENLSIAVLEAMSHGLPCVTSNVGGLPEIVVNGVTGFTCPPNDVDAHAASIKQLLADITLRKKMGDAGKERAEKLFSRASQEAKILQVYAMCTGERPREEFMSSGPEGLPR
jgi:glycosyltransferase involved in cell wall biosynthesis